MTNKYKLQVYPALVLKQRAKEVLDFNQDLKEKTDAMFEIMYEYNGIGLAGNQAGIAERIVVVDLGKEQDQGRVFINPEIIEAGADRESSEEGCLSFPDIYEPVMRSKAIKIKYVDLQGNSHEEEMDGLLARCLQHEVDHLNGIVFVDRVSKARKIGLKKKLRNLAN